MKRVNFLISGIWLLTLLPLATPVVHAANRAEGKKGVAATVQPVATKAAMDAFKRGGNAIDAAVAAGLTLGVVDGHDSGIGGGCFMLIRLADGRFFAIDAREMAPAAAKRDMFLRDGIADTRLSQVGALGAGVPGELAAFDYAVTNFGRLKLRDALLPAAEVAEKGFHLDKSYARKLEGTAKDLALFEASRAVFLNKGKHPYLVGDKLKQPDLAKTYRAIAEHGAGWFYGGPFAEATAKWMRENGGIMTVEDLKNYRLKLREPVRTTYRGHEIVGFPPPSSGGVHVAQVLNMLEHFDLKAMGPKSPDYVHVVSESLKMAFADRVYWLGDPDFTKVPRGLVDKDYAAKLAKRIQMDRTIHVSEHGSPPRVEEEWFGKHTTHFTTADAEGNWVACTATINTSFGCKVVVPGTGVLLNNEMDDFSAQPNVANAFGLLGGDANEVAPGKRPLSSMSPTIVLKDGKPVFSAGAAGGPTIISQVLLAIINHIDFGMDPATALAQPRLHHQWSPDWMKIESKVGEGTLEELAKRGHKLTKAASFGAAQAMGISADGRKLQAACDPRGEGSAEGY